MTEKKIKEMVNIKENLTAEQARHLIEVLQRDEDTQLAIRVQNGVDNLEAISALTILFTEEEKPSV